MGIIQKISLNFINFIASLTSDFTFAYASNIVTIITKHFTRIDK